MKMLAPSCLTSLDRKRQNNNKYKTHNRDSPQKKASFALLYQDHSLTLDMCKDHCTVAGL